MTNSFAGQITDRNFLQATGFRFSVAKANKVGFFGKALKKRLESSIQIENFMENCREMVISVLGFQSLWNKALNCP